MYIKIIDDLPEPYSIGQLRQDNPQVSFPQDIPQDTLAEYGVFPVTATTPPTHNETEVAEKVGFLQRADGSWEQAWRVRPMNEQELESVTQEKDYERKRAYQNEADPLFFKWQRGEATQQQWLDKINEIKAAN